MSELSENKKIDRVFTIPNILSFFRVLLIPIIIWLYCFKKDYVMTIVVIAISALTDVVDGFIARKFNMISNFGKIFDPFADKLTQVTIVSCLITRYKYMLIPLIILIIKDLFVATSSYIVVRKTNIVTGAEWYGKLCTVLLFLMSVIHIGWIDIPDLASYIIIGIVTLMMILSGVLYGCMDHKIISEHENLKESNA